jgi:hypothetical protein
LYEALRSALGDELGWLGRNVTLADIRHGLPNGRPRILGGQVKFSSLPAVRDVSRFAFLLSNPISRCHGMWRHAHASPSHPHHAIAQTLSLGEIIEERHPFREDLVNLQSRFLTAARQPAGAPSALRTVMTHPFLVGEAQHSSAFADALARELGIAASTLDPAAFAEANRDMPQGDLRERLRRVNEHDLALIGAVRGMRHPDEFVLRTDPPATR